MDIYQEIEEFYRVASGEKTIIGESLLHRKIFALKIGQGSPMGIVQYALHAREFVTAKLAKTHYRHGQISGSVWLIPLANPDGALLSQTGLSSVENVEVRERLLQLNGGNEDFSLWKANARGVDLNVNFPARWGEGKQNTKKAGAENYIGSFAFSESETVALRDFTLAIRPDYTLSYHTKGEEIYWYFSQSTRTCSRDLRLAIEIARVTGYTIAKAQGSVGGYKDWCIDSLHIPSFTIEAGADNIPHPLQGKTYSDIKNRNKHVLSVLSKAVKKEMSI